MTQGCSISGISFDLSLKLVMNCSRLHICQCVIKCHVMEFICSFFLPLVLHYINCRTNEEHAHNGRGGSQCELWVFADNLGGKCQDIKQISYLWLKTYINA